MMIKTRHEELSSIAPADYPALFKELHAYKDALFVRLELMIGRFETMEPAHIDEAGKEWYFASFRFWAFNYGGSLTTWSNAIHYLAALGLIELRKPTKKTTIPAMRASFKIAKEKKRRTNLWYHFPAYTPELLSAAEKIVLIFKAKGINRSGFNKAANIKAIGQDKANHVFIDGRTVSRKEKAAERAIIQAIKDGILQRGYITKAEAMHKAQVWLVSKKRKMKKAEAKGRLHRIWQNRNKRLLEDARAKYHRPNKEDKLRYGLQSDEWIITAAC